MWVDEAFRRGLISIFQTVASLHGVWFETLTDAFYSVKCIQLRAYRSPASNNMIGPNNYEAKESESPVHPDLRTLDMNLKPDLWD